MCRQEKPAEADIAYRFDDLEMTGFLADGAGGASAPGVLVCHEATGLGDRARQAARRLATMGFTALAMDLYGETFPVEGTSARQAPLLATPGLMAGRAEAALAALADLPHFDSNRLAAIGFCQGGGDHAGAGAAPGADLRRDRLSPVIHSTFWKRRRAISAKILMLVGAADPLVAKPTPTISRRK